VFVAADGLQVFRERLRQLPRARDAFIFLLRRALADGLLHARRDFGIDVSIPQMLQRAFDDLRARRGVDGHVGLFRHARLWLLLRRVVTSERDDEADRREQQTRDARGACARVSIFQMDDPLFQVPEA
jgi:hypothetical protein